jgi:solute carrier family 6 amino acid/orphan transporter-like 15/16/17/18/20
MQDVIPFLLAMLQAAEGTGLAFIVFTQAIVELPGAPFWAVIFFLMLLALGLGSQIGILEGMLCTIFDIDIFKRIPKQYVTGMLATVYTRSWAYSVYV